ncbi:XTP/dITP diphosphatase [Limosilactobacillus sp. RRLNB_1_1]|uniref:dITP/XTP pyrophosphatase n=1 Tax=Limosilactobacillus albertensis TaxID=2759752 RepID=A0A7W3TS72_9LACO|nr:XTP/dITP diphosphatase [Limosilactobacillus albertensis]MBB1069711.1 XTP/dITP diphosphatase [Limosilactobacillus albertensis]MCD7117827.1 XTP/dITP diphosphatase [Limosilactobacillus albertensis]MCD7128463.1 XTP/dITP diphosphatase [Limosilactobacillus albertensis]
MKNIVIATNNPGKAQEYEKMFSPLGFVVHTLKDFDPIIINEDGTTFEENATIKATTVMKKLNIPVIADDSGLMVDALNGEPGIHSARYAGDHDDLANRKKLLQELKNIPDEKRTAHFHTTIVALKPNGKKLVANGRVDGHILHEAKGSNGFGYDPIFYVDSLHCSMAELTPEQKNKISHRGNALRALMKNFDEWWND